MSGQGSTGNVIAAVASFFYSRFGAIVAGENLFCGVFLCSVQFRLFFLVAGDSRHCGNSGSLMGDY